MALSDSITYPWINHGKRHDLAYYILDSKTLYNPHFL
jgi:hypothetical protein